MKELTERVAQLRADLQEAEHALAEAEAKEADSSRFLSNDIIDIQIKPFHSLNQCHLCDRIRVSLWLLGPNRQGPRIGVNVVEFGATIWDRACVDEAVCNARMRTAHLLDASTYLTKQHALRAPSLGVFDSESGKWMANGLGKSGVEYDLVASPYHENWPKSSRKNKQNSIV